MNKEEFLNTISDTQLYKKSAKQYKVAIGNEDLTVILITTEVIQNCLEELEQQQQQLLRQHAGSSHSSSSSSSNATKVSSKAASNKISCKPLTILNAIRFVKETLERIMSSKSNIPPKSQFIDLVSERVLPAMSRFALFRKESKEEDRGKFFFSDKPTTETAIIGNSLFHLLLECLLVWGARLKNSPYSAALENLLRNEHVTFPKELNYFKEEIDKNAIEKYLASITNTQVQQQEQQKQPPEVSEQQQQHVTQESPQKQKNKKQQQQQHQVSIEQQQVSVELIKQSSEFGKSLSPIFDSFSKFKEELHEKLSNENASNHLLDKSQQHSARDEYTRKTQELKEYARTVSEFDKEFKELIEKALSLDSSPSMEYHLSRLYDERDFCTSFLADCASFSHQTISLADIQKKIITQIARMNPKVSSHNSFSISPVLPSQQGARSRPPTILEVDHDEEERKEGPNEQQNKRNSKNINNNQHQYSETPTPEGIQNDFTTLQEQKGNYGSVEEPTQKSLMSSRQLQQSQYSQFSQQSSFREVLSSNDLDKYKFSMHSSASYHRKRSTSPANQTMTFSSNHAKSAVFKKSAIRSQHENTGEAGELSNLRKQVQSLLMERDMWKDKFNMISLKRNQLLEQNLHVGN